MRSRADQRHADALQLTHERNRLTELFKYFRSTSRAVHRNAVNIDSTETYQPAAARLSADPALNAFAQLGCLRLQCDRAFISLIDNENQHIVAEATQSISLYDQEQRTPGDELALGEMPLDLFAGVCAGTIKVFTSQDGRYNESTPNIFADQTRYVINDFTLEATYRDRPYVKGFPHMRYYAEVPLTTPGGYVIGSFCVVDNKPRRGISDEGFRILQEIASTIMRHLGLVKTDYEHVRAGRLLDGLNNFVQGEANMLDISNSRDRVAIKDDNCRLQDVADPRQEDLRQSGVPQLFSGSRNGSLGDSGSAGGSEDLDHVKHSSMTSAGSSTGLNNDVAKSIGEDPIRDTPVHDGQTLGPSTVESSQSPPDGVSTQDQIVTNFQRASWILRQAMDLDGVVFLGALPSTFGSDLQNTMAKKLGYSVRKSSGPTEDAVQPGQFSLPESVHQSLLTKYPRGHVFAIDGEVSTYTSTCLPEPKTARNCAEPGAKTAGLQPKSEVPHRHDIDAVIQTNFPAARSLIFMPFWNPHKNQWFVGCIGWTTDKKRVLSSKEFGYFSAFGNSIMAEVSRLELLATDNAKSDFISSISHELRSPLHGILGSAELLRGMNPNDDQWQMIEMIETCGRTLLDTMEHILDYSKINNLKGGIPALHGENSHASDAHHRSDFDLSVLVEDTVEGTMAGHRFNSRSRSQTGTSLNNRNDGSSNPLSAHKQDPDVILHIEYCPNWSIKSDVGAWRRILLNLFGNALKYTPSGFIEIALRSTTAKVAEQGKYMTVVSLVVSDTGRGMSQEYLQNHLYKPFMQEDAFSVGVGLGLSIVHKLVGDLGGRISIESGLGSGTQVTVTVPVETIPPQSSIDKRLLQWSDKRTLHVLTPNKNTQSGPTSPQILSETSKSAIALMKAFTAQAEQWFNIIISSVQDVTSIAANVVAVHESHVYLLEKKDGKTIASLHIPSNMFVIVIRSGASTELDPKSPGTKRIQYLTQPIGPRKLAKVLVAWFDQPEREPVILMNSLSRLEGNIDGFDGTSQAKQKRGQKPTFSPDPEAASDGSKVHPSVAAAHESSLVERLKPPGMRLLSDASISPGLPTHHAGRRSHLLLVDDNEINLKMLVVYMKKLNCTFATATNGQLALETYRQSKEIFDYVLMDISMPIMDGFESTRHIRAFEQENGMTPSVIIALTGLGSVEAQREASKSGIDLFLPKPVPMQKLKSIVEKDLSLT